MKIWELEEEAIITEEYKDITNNDMHIIEAVGLERESTMSIVAKPIGITAGSLTAVNSLVNKKYLLRIRSEEDRRKYFVRLTEKGRRHTDIMNDFSMR